MEPTRGFSRRQIRHRTLSRGSTIGGVDLPGMYHLSGWISDAVRERGDVPQDAVRPARCRRHLPGRAPRTSRPHRFRRSDIRERRSLRSQDVPDSGEFRQRGFRAGRTLPTHVRLGVPELHRHAVPARRGIPRLPAGERLFRAGRRQYHGHDQRSDRVRDPRRLSGLRIHGHRQLPWRHARRRRAGRASCGGRTDFLVAQHVERARSRPARSGAFEPRAKDPAGRDRSRCRSLDFDELGPAGCATNLADQRAPKQVLGKVAVRAMGRPRARSGSRARRSGARIGRCARESSRAHAWSAKPNGGCGRCRRATAATRPGSSQAFCCYGAE